MHCIVIGKEPEYTAIERGSGRLEVTLTDGRTDRTNGQQQARREEVTLIGYILYSSHAPMGCCAALPEGSNSVRDHRD